MKTALALRIDAGRYRSANGPDWDLLQRTADYELSQLEARGHSSVVVQLSIPGRMHPPYAHQLAWVRRASLVQVTGSFGDVIADWTEAIQRATGGAA